MRLPFDSGQFFAVFARYNEAVFPAQVLHMLLALVAIALLFRRESVADALQAAILGLFWIWTGLAYHLAFFTAINPLAYAFAALSVAGGGLFLWQGVFRRRLRFRWRNDARGSAGTALILFSLLVYPAWTIGTGHTWPTFGLPCPTTLFTIGLLGFLEPPWPRGPMVVPILWCAIGAQAAFLLDVLPDLSLIAAGAFGLWLVVDNGSGGSLRPPASSKTD